jgi:hypothetical protein
MRSFVYKKNVKLKDITKFDEVKVIISIFVLISTLSFHAVVLLVCVVIVVVFL